MRMRGMMFAFVGFGLLATAAGAEPVMIGPQTKPQEPAGPRTGDKVSFCGRVVPLVEFGCIGVVGQRETVELTQVTPKPEAGKIVSGIGTVSNQPNMCMQGLHIAAATWKEVTSCN